MAAGQLVLPLEGETKALFLKRQISRIRHTIYAFITCFCLLSLVVLGVEWKSSFFSLTHSLSLSFSSCCFLRRPTPGTRIAITIDQSRNKKL
ncbi:hypothetical protein I7I48_02461 [Histoplasma ohiense]|nr:hypothetical protein I7I48_02461 [Histoplasma ohiense (nom. inval.)]